LNFGIIDALAKAGYSPKGTFLDLERLSIAIKMKNAI
jgi:hypothetical protein